jgi:predicted GIY-YIG superfamily endonuclease
VIYTVHVLCSDGHNSHYTGFPNNLELRLKSRDEFGNGWTIKYKSWRLVFRKDFDSKTAAREYEKWVKKGVGRECNKSLNLIQILS